MNKCFLRLFTRVWLRGDRQEHGCLKGSFIPEKPTASWVLPAWLGGISARRRISSSHCYCASNLGRGALWILYFSGACWACFVSFLSVTPPLPQMGRFHLEERASTPYWITVSTCPMPTTRDPSGLRKVSSWLSLVLPYHVFFEAVWMSSLHIGADAKNDKHRISC